MTISALEIMANTQPRGPPNRIQITQGYFKPPPAAPYKHKGVLYQGSDNNAALGGLNLGYGARELSGRVAPLVGYLNAHLGNSEKIHTALGGSKRPGLNILPDLRYS